MIFSSCEKKLFDYRNDYIGRWEFTSTLKEHNTDSIGYSFHVVIIYTGEIKYGEGDNDLRIQYTPDHNITVGVDKGGTLTQLPNHHCKGEFIGRDNLDLFLRWGGLGAYGTHTIKGIKK